MDFQEFKARYQKVAVEQYPTQVGDKPLVSVCVQTYQHAPYIKECLDGILMQKTNFNFEILLGEDASTDGTREICREYAEKYPEKIRFFLHNRENNIRISDKPTGRFNFVYNLFSAKGKYIALCEGDDHWTDLMKLQKQIDFLEVNQNYSLCGHRSRLLTESGMTEKILGNFNKETFSHFDVAGSNIRIPTASIVFRNQIFFPEWFFKIYGGDMALIYLCSEKGFIKILDFVGSVYRVHSGGIEQFYKNKKKKWTLAERNIKEYLHYRDLFKGKAKHKIERKLAWNYFYLAIIRMMNLRLLQALACFSKATFYKLSSLRRSN